MSDALTMEDRALARSIDGCAHSRSTDRAARSVDGTDRSMAHNT